MDTSTKEFSDMAIKRVQLLLNSSVKPSPHLMIDGRIGSQTRQAIRAFQVTKGLNANGKIDYRTLTALGLKLASSVMLPTLKEDAALKPPDTKPSWIDIAVAELGVHEDSLPRQHNSRILEYHKTTTLKATEDETPWCSSFVNWAMEQAGYRGTGSALAKSWLDWGKNVNKPFFGAIIVIKKKTAGMTQATGSPTGFHVGFFVGLSATHVRILGGNQGDQVKYSWFALQSYDIKGFRSPICR